MLGPGGPIPHLETGLKEPQQKNLLKSNECLILKLGNHVGYVNSPTRKGGSRIQNRTLHSLFTLTFPYFSTAADLYGLIYLFIYLFILVGEWVRRCGVRTSALVRT